MIDLCETSGKRWGYILDEGPTHCRANIERQRTVHTLGQFTLANLSIPQMHVFRLWEEARVPEENPR